MMSIAHAPYRAEIKIKNNRVWHALVAVCPTFTSVADAARKLGFRNAVLLGEALNMTKHFRARGDYHGQPPHERPFGKSAELIASALHSTPEYLFDAELYWPGLVERNQVFQVNGDGFRQNILSRYGWQEIDPLVEVEQRELCARVDAALQTLTPREEKIIRKRYGIGDDYEEESVSDIANDFEVCGQRILQISAKALRKLRHPSRSKALRSFAESL
jgi:hypothetical protein